MRAGVLAAVLVALGGCARHDPAPRRDRSVGFLKGQLHLHSSFSADSETPPADVARWYAARGYDFIVFTDHEHVTVTPGVGRMLAIPGVELTQNLRTCEPPPEPGLACLLHVNALFARVEDPVPWGPVGSARRLDLYGRALDVAHRLGGLAQLNHPNFHHAADAALVTALARRGLHLMEIANQSADVDNEGDARHPSTEALWDAVLAAGPLVWGVASDDAHHYDDAGEVRARGEVAEVGDRGFVMVRAARDPASIRAALEAGRFYASTGVVLSRADVSSRAIDLQLAPASQGDHDITLVGAGGRVLAEVHGRHARFELSQQRGVVRAVVKDAHGHRAWLQPVRANAR